MVYVNFVEVNELKPFSSRILMSTNESLETTFFTEGLESYGTVVYLEYNCLALKDLGYLFKTFLNADNHDVDYILASKRSPGELRKLSFFHIF